MVGDADRSGVTVKVTRRRGVVFAEVHGEIDTETYRSVRQELFACLDGGCAALVVDLTGVGFLGSMGIAVLVEVRERAEQVEVAFAVAAGQRTVVQPMRVSEVDELLGLRSTVAEAVAVMQGGTRRRGSIGPDRPVRNTYVDGGAEPVDNGFSWWSS